MLTYEQASDKVIIALDCSKERAFELADLLGGKATWVKVGMTLFYAEGPSIVDAMRERGLRVFLDLKVHDIPFQVQGAVRAASLTGADILSIHHTSGSAVLHPRLLLAWPLRGLPIRSFHPSGSFDPLGAVYRQ